MRLATDYIHPAPPPSRCRVRVFLPDEPERVPGEEARYVRAKEGVRRMLETVPLTEEERLAAEGDEGALNALLAKGDAVPVPAGRQRAVEQTIVPLVRKPRRG